MEKILQHPEIIDPYQTGAKGFSDKAFVEDIGVDDLLNGVPFTGQDTRKFARKVLVDMGVDIKTAVYRQDVFEELLENSTLRDNLRENIKAIYRLKVKWYNCKISPNMTNGLEMVKKYQEFIEHPRDMSMAGSEALQAIDAYFNEIGQSDTFRKLARFINKTRNLDGVDFRVTLDKHCNPLSLLTMDLVEKKPGQRPRIPFIERFLGKKEEGRALRDSGKLNELGKLVESYLENEFAPVFRRYAEHIKELTDLIEALDFYAGFADYFIKLKTLEFDLCRPVLLQKEMRKMAVKRARNPLLLDKRLMSAGNSNNIFMMKTGIYRQKVVPNDIEYRSEKNMFIITGPNNGGKSTYVKTVGLIQLLSLTGLFVPASFAEVTFVDGIYTHFVAPDDIAQGEGRYRNELKRMKEVIEKATPYSLVILDEPCGGTSYEEGLRQSMTLLDGFHKLGPAVYFTTHMHPITKEVDKGRYPAAKNMSVECFYENRKMNYSYKIKSGASGKSYGEEIAKEIGLMPDNIVQTVSRKARENGYGKILRK